MNAEKTGMNNETAEAEYVEEISGAEIQHELLASGEFSEWNRSFLNGKVPSLFLDRSLRILSSNDSFCRLFACDPRPNGLYFTQFFTPFFDEAKSAELFRAILSEETGYTWSGRVERIGWDQLLIISKVWVVPILGMESPAPKAFSAFCLDMTIEYRQLLNSTFSSLLGAARLKDNDTGNHIERVNRYARVLAGSLVPFHSQWPQVDRQFVESIGQVAALHDLGKIGTPDDILNKEGPLEAWEWDVMKQHTTNGAYILSTYPNPMAREIALRHHEKWNGTGYPHGLSGDLTPLSARIVAFADVYDALRMRRTYKEPYPHDKAVQIISRESGTHFDPAIMDRFLGVADRFDEIFNELADSA
jgi:HD-GYP domain-containing protein (c-di-GMP phosphodiesterase class II)